MCGLSTRRWCAILKENALFAFIWTGPAALIAPGDRLVGFGPASAATGRKASASAVVRALLAWAAQEDLGAELVRLMAAELQTGEVVWGKARTRGS